jgi:hypothetical protein
MSKIADAYVNLIPTKGETDVNLSAETWDAILAAVNRTLEVNNQGKYRIADAYVSVNITTKDGENVETTVAKIQDHLEYLRK